MSNETDEVVLTDQRRYPHGVPSWVDVTQTDLGGRAASSTAGCSAGS